MLCTIIYISRFLSFFFYFYSYTCSIYSPSYNLTTRASPPFFSLHVFFFPLIPTDSRTRITLSADRVYARRSVNKKSYHFFSRLSVCRISDDIRARKRKNPLRSKNQTKIIIWKKNKTKQKKNVSRSRESQVRPRRSSRCDCLIRCTAACCRRESVTRATCAAKPSPRSSP